MTIAGDGSAARSVLGSRKAMLFTGVLGLALGIGGTLGWVGNRETRVEPPPNEGEPIRFPGSSVHDPVPAALPAPAASPSATVPPMDTARLIPASGERIAEGMARYEANFRMDKPDASWGPSAERNLVEAATDPALTEFGVPTSFNALCLGRMCKITMMFETQGQASDWAELYVLGTAGTISLAQTLVIPHADGRAELVFYGARAGSESLLAEPAPARPHRATR